MAATQWRIWRMGSERNICGTLAQVTPLQLLSYPFLLKKLKYILTIWSKAFNTYSRCIERTQTKPVPYESYERRPNTSEKDWSKRGHRSSAGLNKETCYPSFEGGTQQRRSVIKRRHTTYTTQNACLRCRMEKIRTGDRLSPCAHDIHRHCHSATM